ncbi:MAG: class I SAM-dependent methyltransferase [Deltaproteobacteria bacterium]|nr:class I SAM-dependent methyltransferase [Deltaproteobacteria bacterium]
MAENISEQRQGWRDFLEGELYTDAQAPWRDDPAFALLLQVPGLRESIGGRATAALNQAIGLVRALARVDLLEGVRTHRPAQGLCLGFGMNALEPYDLLQVFALERVDAYEWIGEHIVEAAQMLQALRAEAALLPTRIRLHHGTISDLSAIADGAIRVAYVANVFTPEIPMTAETFARALREIVRVLAVGGILLSRGSSGTFETELTQYGRMLLQTPLISVFEKAP